MRGQPSSADNFSVGDAVGKVDNTVDGTGKPKEAWGIPHPL